jgi:hypothetical protein
MVWLSYCAGHEPIVKEYKMQSKYVNAIPDTIARFDYSHVNDKTQKCVELAAELLWNRGTRANDTDVHSTYGELVKAQRLAIVGLYIDQIINALAREQIRAVKFLEAGILSNAEIVADEEIK